MCPTKGGYRQTGGGGSTPYMFSTEDDLLAVLSGGPWVIQDHLLSLQRWKDNFDPSTASFKITPVWLRFLNLPLDFWDGLTLGEIAAYAGTPVKTETTVEETGHCHYAQALVEVDLQLPLCPGIWIGKEKRWQSFVYERIPNVCQVCGRITHVTTSLQAGPSNASTKGSSTRSQQQDSQQNGIPLGESGEGQWKTVPPRRRLKTTSPPRPGVAQIDQSKQKYLEQGKGASLAKNGTCGNPDARTYTKQNPTAPNNGASTPEPRLQTNGTYHKYARPGTVRSSPVIQPPGFHVTDQSNMHSNTSPSTGPQTQGKLVEVPSTKAIVMVEDVVKRASKKRVLEEDASHSPMQTEGNDSPS
ncbi:hypothetical protein QJS10_CPB11g01006 [Acorus calamus]|uniref:DUF4283 domain-containing protein n=1 Tax=Acorus calamus TaxID=4465 RepID=A0AAV9DWR2_ACOCL|nr:hypothetical protein QJS10_CPB11g01006 [Acorus calamus]